MKNSAVDCDLFKITALNNQNLVLRNFALLLFPNDVLTTSKTIQLQFIQTKKKKIV